MGDTFTVGGRYILLLRRHDTTAGPYYTTGVFSADGVYQVVDGKLATASRRDLGMKTAAKGPDGLRRELRQYRERIPFSYAGTDPGKPIVEKTMDLANRNRMETLERMWAAAAVVVEAQFVSSRPRDLTNGLDQFISVNTDYEVQIIEVFKGDGRVTAAGQRITLRQRGGDTRPQDSARTVPTRSLTEGSRRPAGESGPAACRERPRRTSARVAGV